MPALATPLAGKSVPVRSPRKSRKSADAPANRRPRQAATNSGGTANASTIQLLQEVVDILRSRAAACKHHDPASADSGEPLCAGKLRGLADQDLRHSRWLSERIAELGGPMGRGSRRTDRDPGQDDQRDVTSPLNADGTCADAVVERYGTLLTLVGESDLTTRFLIEDILFDELERSREQRAVPAR